MAIVKKRNEQTDARLLLESSAPVELPPAEIADAAVLVQFDKFKPYVAELLETLRAGTTAEPVPVMMDGSTFAVHTQTRTFWIKLWHKPASGMTRIERAQVISCLPSTRGLRIMVDDHAADVEDQYDDDQFDDDDDDMSNDETKSLHD